MILPINVQLNGQRFSCFSDKLFVNPRFFVKIAKTCFLKKKMILIEFLHHLSLVGNRLV